MTSESITTPAGEVTGSRTPFVPAPGPDEVSRPPVPDSTPPSEPPTPDALPEGSVPADLVGEWDGDGPGPARLTKIAFTADGAAVLYANSGQTHHGTAVVSGSAMTIYIPGSEMVVNEWSIESFEVDGYVFENLTLDGVSYVRQISAG